MRIVKPHRNVSRKVEPSDIPRVEKEAKKMLSLCKRLGGIAIAHPQVNVTSPLRFFVTIDGEIIINPEALTRAAVPYASLEGCLTFPGMQHTYVLRSYACHFRYEIIEDSKLLAQEKRLSGIQCIMFQHETDHLNAKYIFDTEYAPFNQKEA